MADGVPVIWHDDVVLVRYGSGPLQSLSIRGMSLADLKVRVLLRPTRVQTACFQRFDT